MRDEAAIWEDLDAEPHCNDFELSVVVKVEGRTARIQVTGLQ